MENSATISKPQEESPGSVEQIKQKFIASNGVVEFDFTANGKNSHKKGTSSPSPLVDQTDLSLDLTPIKEALKEEMSAVARSGSTTPRSGRRGGGGGGDQQKTTPRAKSPLSSLLFWRRGTDEATRPPGDKDDVARVAQRAVIEKEKLERRQQREEKQKKEQAEKDKKRRAEERKKRGQPSEEEEELSKLKEEIRLMKIDHDMQMQDCEEENTRLRRERNQERDRVDALVAENAELTDEKMSLLAALTESKEMLANATEQSSKELKESEQQIKHLLADKEVADVNIKNLQDVQKQSMHVIAEIERKVAEEHATNKQALESKVIELVKMRTDAQAKDKQISILEGQVRELQMKKGGFGCFS